MSRRAGPTKQEVPPGAVEFIEQERKEFREILIKIARELGLSLENKIRTLNPQKQQQQQQNLEDQWFDSIIKFVTTNLQNFSSDIPRYNENVSDESFKSIIKHITHYESTFGKLRTEPDRAIIFAITNGAGYSLSRVGGLLYILAAEPKNANRLISNSYFVSSVSSLLNDKYVSSTTKRNILSAVANISTHSGTDSTVRNELVKSDLIPTIIESVKHTFSDSDSSSSTTNAIDENNKNNENDDENDDEKKEGDENVEESPSKPVVENKNKPAENSKESEQRKKSKMEEKNTLGVSTFNVLYYLITSEVSKPKEFNKICQKFVDSGVSKFLLEVLKSKDTPAQVLDKCIHFSNVFAQNDLSRKQLVKLGIHNYIGELFVKRGADISEKQFSNTGTACLCLAHLAKEKSAAEDLCKNENLLLTFSTVLRKGQAMQPFDNSKKSNQKSNEKKEGVKKRKVPAKPVALLNKKNNSSTTTTTTNNEQQENNNNKEEGDELVEKEEKKNNPENKPEELEEEDGEVVEVNSPMEYIRFAAYSAITAVLQGADEKAGSFVANKLGFADTVLKDFSCKNRKLKYCSIVGLTALSSSLKDESGPVLQKIVKSNVLLRMSNQIVGQKEDLAYSMFGAIKSIVTAVTLSGDEEAKELVSKQVKDSTNLKQILQLLDEQEKNQKETNTFGQLKKVLLLIAILVSFLVILPIIYRLIKYGRFQLF